MEGIEEPNIKGERIEEEIEEEPVEYKEKNKGRKAPLVVGIIIGIIIGFVLFSPNMIGLLYEESESEQQHQKGEPEIPIYENYIMFESEDTKTYRNENLTVQIVVEYYYTYDGLLYDINYYASHSFEVTITSNEDSPNDLLSAILQNSRDLTDNQLKWFNFTCKNILPIRHYVVYFIGDSYDYLNNEIKVSIWYYGTDVGWDASWTYNNKDEILSNNTLDALFSDIEKHKTKMSSMQYEWFKYMCTVELK